ncbi:Mis12 protein-domain-containing protein [Apiospora arundinis]|uniref:Mis12 protein-domain-containing protein n=1 Tax=Apiospora arundinis TaxID=335852 RepID=A0ABR2J4X3_9PEZI
MAATATSDTELVTEHFGYPPVSLIDDIINSINILAERALNSVEQGLLNLPPATLGFKAAKGKGPALDPEEYAERAKTEIESGTHQLETLLTTNIDRNFDKLELYVLRNIFSVKPPDLRNYIRLSHYDGLDFSSLPSPTTEAAAADGQQQNAANGSDSDKPTLESIGQLRKKLRESMRLNALLHAEQERNARLVSDLRGLLGMPGDVKTEETSSSQEPSQAAPLAFLHQKVGSLKAAGPDTPLSTTTAFTLSQLQALRALSTSLRTMAPDLAPTPDAEAAEGVNDDDPTGRKTWRRERFEYVETATRRHLEHVQGLELGKDGEVRDGEWQGEGRKLAMGEVEGLERIVSLLDGDSGSASSAKGGQQEENEKMDES